MGRAAAATAWTATAEAVQAEIVNTTAEQNPIPITREDLLRDVPLDVLIITFEQINDSRNPNSKGTGKLSRKR